MQLSQKGKSFAQFCFWNLHQILKIFKKIMILTANVFPKVGTVKILVKPLSKKRRFRTHFHSQHVKASQNLPNLHESAFVRFFHYSRGS